MTKTSHTIDGKASAGLTLSNQERDLLIRLENKFASGRRALLAERQRRQEAWDRGITPDFGFETASLRKSRWRAAPLQPVMRDRRVEVIVPATEDAFDAALQANATGIVVDLEDALSPTAANLGAGQQLLSDYWRRCSGASTEPLISVRVRGWHMEDIHALGDGQAMSASLVDAALYVMRNTGRATELGRPLLLCLPKLEHADEAELWSQVFNELRQSLSLPEGSLCCAVIIETLPGLFHTDEIVHALSDYIVSLHAGRWDYLFSFIKTFRQNADHLLGDRATLTASQVFLQTYSRLLIDIAHRRGILAMGGTGSTVPTEINGEADMTIRARVRQEKLAEVILGFDGTWVAHPALAGVARSVFDEHMPQANQAYRVFKGHAFSASELLDIEGAEVSVEGVRSNVRAALRYLASWLSGVGTVVIDGRLEHLGTAEIARVQLWQWLRHGVELDDGGHFTENLFDSILEEQFDAAHGDALFQQASLQKAKDLLSDLVKADELTDFITDKALKELP